MAAGATGGPAHAAQASSPSARQAFADKVRGAGSIAGIDFENTAAL